MQLGDDAGLSEESSSGGGEKSVRSIWETNLATDRGCSRKIARSLA